jgi:hypothetical protein
MFWQLESFWSIRPFRCFVVFPFACVLSPALPLSLLNSVMKQLANDSIMNQAKEHVFPTSDAISLDRRWLAEEGGKKGN